MFAFLTWFKKIAKLRRCKLMHTQTHTDRTFVCTCGISAGAFTNPHAYAHNTHTASKRVKIACIPAGT